MNTQTLTEQERKEMIDHLRAAFSLIKKLRYSTEKAEKLMDELNRLYAQTSQLNLF